MLKVQCECGKKHLVPENAVGKRGRCGSCKREFVIKESAQYGHPKNARNPNSDESSRLARGEKSIDALAQLNSVIAEEESEQAAEGFALHTEESTEVNFSASIVDKQLPPCVWRDDGSELELHCINCGTHSTFPPTELNKLGVCSNPRCQAKYMLSPAGTAAQRESQKLELTIWHLISWGFGIMALIYYVQSCRLGAGLPI